MASYAPVEWLAPAECETNLEHVAANDQDWMTSLRELSCGWDGEDAPVPSEDSIIRAKEVLEWIRRNDLKVESVDPDVLGGVDIYLNGVDGKTVWIALLNAKKPSVVLRHGGEASGLMLDDAAREQLKSFLRGGARGSTRH
jgi:hypothetical protein